MASLGLVLLLMIKQGDNVTRMGSDHRMRDSDRARYLLTEEMGMELYDGSHDSELLRIYERYPP